MESGDEVTVRTLDCFSNTITDESQLFSTVGWDKVNPATGPIAIHGARPGDTLKVEVLSIEVGEQATMTTHPDFGALPGTVEERTRIVPIRDGKAQFSDDITIPIRPMFGVIGTAPASESVPTGEPRQHGGNMDTKEIVAGSTLYLPVEVDGANLSLGDVHAVMGDGEVAACGAEIEAEVKIRVTVLEGHPHDARLARECIQPRHHRRPHVAVPGWRYPDQPDRRPPHDRPLPPAQNDPQTVRRGTAVANGQSPLRICFRRSEPLRGSDGKPEVPERLCSSFGMISGCRRSLFRKPYSASFL